MNEPLSPEPQKTPFDAEGHRRTAEAQYTRVRGLYRDFAETVRDILSAALDAAAIRYHSIEARAKSVASFGAKAVSRDPNDPERPKYENPLEDITDLAAARVITFLPSILSSVDSVVLEQFELVEKQDKRDELLHGERFGYQSIHYVVRLRPERMGLPEYSRFAGLTVEIQARTILQHAWAEMEHDIAYKSPTVIPATVRRRFAALAGMLEIADREFEAIQQEDEQLRRDARRLVAEGRLSEVEVTPDALRAYLDEKLGPDGRMTPFSYEFLANDLRHMGFQTLDQIDDAIEGYDDDLLSRIVYGNRWGQIARLEVMLLAGMGELFTQIHRWQHGEFWSEVHRNHISILKAAGVAVRTYDPRATVRRGVPD